MTGARHRRPFQASAAAARDLSGKTIGVSFGISSSCFLLLAVLPGGVTVLHRRRARA